ncbi:hypothetical protein BKH43_06495 [Helicobacter sp. 13S00401-1]|uniref:CDP-glycerol glycerophosphotransferase family protein n=1 Tax=Helicobacter sp. 13S00401-1 TaxID=1905758 RepID=UPI000BDC88A2|nr:CDP-glycerol glycerophosphotransferase family protein [Helicobacter sp. 13S00401-1]PAF49652.1 hypothetical protein BKH43_06495 [Helicobacter sp. 13S00401-1]
MDKTKWLIKNFILPSSYERVLIRFLRKIRHTYILERLYCKLARKFCKVRANKIVFVNPHMMQYFDSTKYILEELLSMESNKLDIVWATSKITDISYMPKVIRKINYNSFRFLYELFTAKALVVNSHIFLPLKKGFIKPKGTVYFQTFHGSMGIKKLDADALEVFDKLGWLKWQKRSCAMFDYLFTDSELEKQIFKTAFWGYGEVLKLGKARDSIFYKDPKPFIDKVKSFYKLKSKDRICLYAPTWRPDKRTYCYNIDINLLKDSLHKRFGGNWKVLIRAHSHMQKGVFETLYNQDEVIDASLYPDMQELQVASDVLISDYSSSLPEFAILKKPSFIYATDLEKYENGFYYDLDVLPCKVARNNYELMTNILGFDEVAFKQKAQEFLEWAGHSDDENSPKRIASFILEKMGARL